MLKIAITGGIGTGKSAVTDYLIDEGFAVYDADEIYAAMIAPGGKAIPYIITYFGEQYIKEDGSLDRAKMSQLVFHDIEKKKLLEKGTTAVVARDVLEILNENEAKGYPVTFVGIPLLFESGMQEEFDSVWLVSADEDVRIARVMERDGRTYDEVKQIIANQMPESKKAEKADEIIDNSGTLDELYSRICELLLKYDLHLRN